MNTGYFFQKIFKKIWLTPNFYTYFHLTLNRIHFCVLNIWYFTYSVTALISWADCWCALWILVRHLRQFWLVLSCLSGMTVITHDVTARGRSLCYGLREALQVCVRDFVELSGHLWRTSTQQLCMFGGRQMRCFSACIFCLWVSVARSQRLWVGAIPRLVRFNPSWRFLKLCMVICLPGSA